MLDLNTCGIEELIGIIKGDKNSPALDVLISRFSHYINSLLNRFSVEEDEKAECYSDACIALYSAVKSFDPSKSVPFEAYAKICVKRALFNTLKKFNRLKRNNFTDCLYIEDLPENFPERAVQLYCECADPQSSFTRKEELISFLNNAKSLLTPFEWSVFSLYIDDFSNQQIAEILGRNVKSISNAVYRIRNKLSVIN